LSADKEKLGQLLQKVEELTGQLSKIQTELRTVSASLKSLAVGEITQPSTSNPASSVPSGKTRTLDDIRMSFPEELETRMGFEDKGDYVMIKPKEYLGTNFVRVASAVRDMGGEYISAGKESHFRVPKKKP
jgi:hypothetical protein